jgi:hypothetical protein
MRSVKTDLEPFYVGGFIVLDQFELMPNVVQTPLRTGKMPGKYSIVASLLLAQISITMERIRNSDELLSRQFVLSDHKRTLDDFIADDAANSGQSHVNLDVQRFQQRLDPANWGKVVETSKDRGSKESTR